MSVREKVAMWMIIVALALMLFGCTVELGWFNVSWFESDLPVAAGMLLLMGGLMTSMWAIATKPIVLDR